MKNLYFPCNFAVVLLLPACQNPCAEAANYPPSVQFGTGSGAYESITEDTILTPSWGLQGGSHIWGALQTTGLYPGVQTLLGGPQNPLTVSFTVSHEDTIFASISDSFVVLTGDSVSAQGYGFTIFIDGFPSDWSYDYYKEETKKLAPISVEVDVTDACGTNVSDTVSTLFSF